MIGLPSPTEIFTAIFVFAVARRLAVVYRRFEPIPPLALQKLRVIRSEDPFVEIVGRQCGLIAFLLMLLGFSERYRLTVRSTDVKCENLNAAEPQVFYIPLYWVATMRGKARRHLWILLLAVCCLLIALSTGLFLTNLQLVELPTRAIVLLLGSSLAGLFLIYLYYRFRSFSLEFHPHGGPSIAVDILPNFLEGVRIDMYQVGDAMALIQSLIGHCSVPAHRSSTFHEIDSPFATSFPSQSNGIAVAEFSPSEPSAIEFPVAARQKSAGPAAPQPVPAETAHSHPEAEELAKSLLAEARDSYNEGKRMGAVILLQQIVSQYPYTQAAGFARRNLKKINE